MGQNGSARITFFAMMCRLILLISEHPIQRTIRKEQVAPPPGVQPGGRGSKCYCSSSTWPDSPHPRTPGGGARLFPCSQFEIPLSQSLHLIVKNGRIIDEADSVTVCP